MTSYRGPRARIRDDIETIERNGVVIWTRPKGDQS